MIKENAKSRPYHRTPQIEGDGSGEMSMTEKATMGEQLWRLTSSIDTPCADSSIHGSSPALPKDPDLQLDAPQGLLQPYPLLRVLFLLSGLLQPFQGLLRCSKAHSTTQRLLAL